METNGYSVYMHTCPNCKVYIGITSQKPIYRWDNGNGYKRNILFNRAIKKYGWDSIKHEVLFEGLTKEQAEQKEIELIAEYKSDQKEHGYNIASGGNANKPTEETRKKISIALKGKNTGKRKPLSAETKKKLSDINKGKHTSRETEFKKGHIPYDTSKAIEAIKDGKVIAVFNAISIASKELNVNLSNISRCCRGERKKAKGYSFRFLNEVAQ